MLIFLTKKTKRVYSEEHGDGVTIYVNECTEEQHKRGARLLNVTVTLTTAHDERYLKTYKEVRYRPPFSEWQN